MQGFIFSDRYVIISEKFFSEEMKLSKKKNSDVECLRTIVNEISEKQKEYGVTDELKPGETKTGSKIKKFKELRAFLRTRKNIRKFFVQLLQLFIGALIAAFGLELFLIPNKVIDGGVVGLSIMANFLVPHIPFGIFLAVLNIPFLYIAYKHIGKNFVFSTIIAIIMLNICSGYVEHFSRVTNDPFLAAIFGGIIDGIGVGLIMRAGGSLDGTEIVAIIVDKKTPFSIGEVVMFINLFILSGAGLLFGWDKAMYSLVAYFVIAKMIDIVTKGLDESYAVMIISQDETREQEVISALSKKFRGVTVLHGQGGFSKLEKQVVYCVVNRLEVSQLKDLVQSIDEKAFITVNPVHDLVGGRFTARAH